MIFLLHLLLHWIYFRLSLKQNIYYQSGESQTIKGSVQDEIVNIVEQDGDWSLTAHTRGQGCLGVRQEDFEKDEKLKAESKSYRLV